MKLEEFKSYRLTIKQTKKTCRCVLTKIQTYGATGMPNDYMFTPMFDDEPLFAHENFYPTFPVPEMLVHNENFEIEEIDGNGDDLSDEVKNNNLFDTYFKKLQAFTLNFSGKGFENAQNDLDTLTLTKEQKDLVKAEMNKRLEGLKAELAKIKAE